MKAARYGFVLFVGLALGVAVALPGFVERAGLRALAAAEGTLGLDIAFDTLEWSLDGTVTVGGVRVRPVDAPPEEPNLFEAASIRAQIAPLWIRRVVRLEHASIHEPVVRIRIRPDGTDNVSPVLIRVANRIGGGDGEGDKEGGGGGLRSFIDTTLPVLEVDALEVTLAIDHPAARMASVPRVISLHRGTVEARNTALLREDDNLSWSITFEETSMDPGHGLALKGELPVRDFDVLRLPLDIRFDRRIELPVKDRVIGLTGASWDGAELVLDGLTLSRNPTLERQGDEGRQDPALETASIVIEPDVEATVVAAKAIIGAADRSVAVHRFLKTIRRIEFDRPRFVFERSADGHNFRDLIPGVAASPEREGGEGDEALGPLMEATRAAVQRLTSSKSAKDGRSFRGLLVRGFTHLERRIAGVSTAALQFADAVPFRQVRIRGGHFGWHDQVNSPTTALEERFENFDLDLALGHDVVTFDAAFQVSGGEDVVNRVEGKVQRTSGGVQLRAQLESLGLTSYRHALPASLRISPTTKLHQTDVTLVWSPTTQVARIEGKIAVEDLGFYYGPLATEPLTNIDFSLDFGGQLDLAAKSFALDEGKMRVGNTQSVIKLEATDYATTPKLSGVFRLHRARAQDVVDAIPVQLIPLLEGLKVGGTLAWQLDFTLDTMDMESLVYNAYPELNQFEVVDMGKRLNIAAVRGTFMHQIRESNGEQIEMLVGPESDKWVAMGRISKYMVKAVTTTEDGSFFRHEGFSPFAIRQSIIANLKKGAFVRGASTISQQLVKNLFLTREKTISRKVQELFITWQLESALTKSQIMELYLNVIEFGPGVYGIRHAARHYYGKHPSDLSPLDAVFLASIIPNPKRYHHQFTRGQVTDRWRRHLRWIMRVMVDRGKLSESEFLAAAPYSPEFRSRAPVVDPTSEPLPDVNPTAVP